MQPSQSLHRATYIGILTDAIRQLTYSENLPFYVAATRVLSEWLGYDIDELVFLDAKDRGIDAWIATEAGIEIIQAKTHNADEDGLLNLSSFDGSGINDLRRAKEFLLHERAENVNRKELQQLLYRWDSAIRSKQMQDVDEPLQVTLHLIILGDGLTDQAQAEFEAFKQSNAELTEVDGVLVQFTAVLHSIDDLLDVRWREDNRKWVDINNNKCEEINLTPAKEDYISDNVNAVFYCKAHDLVMAYDVLGYQIFEPNVRANIKNSRVNEAIRNSVIHQRSRKEFRFLNNGVTIICSNFVKPRQRQHSFFRVRQPGIINGLQTVVALHTAYMQLDDTQKADFEENCFVLVRLLVDNAVSDITTVVKATNNQNPMKPRNLVSNSLEQLSYVKLFSQELGWFYEAKEGAWDAFESDPRRWRPSLGKKSKDFKVSGTRKTRKIDNERLAQTWLAFIGFAPDAINKKRELFDERYYSVIFRKQLRQHGWNYNTIAQSAEDSMDQAPSCHLLLMSYLTREFAQGITPSAQQNRSETCSRLGLDPKLPKAELDVLLSRDNTFTLNQALSGMSMLFTEFVGHIFYNALGEKLHLYGNRILSNGSYRSLTVDYDIERIADIARVRKFEPDDLLVMLWLCFEDTIDDLLTRGGWGDSYRAAPVKVRFIFSDETRKLLRKHIDETNDFMKKRTLREVWAYGIEEGQNVFEFVRHICLR